MKYLIEFVRIKIVIKPQLLTLDNGQVFEFGFDYLLDSNYIIYWENIYCTDEIQKKITESKILNLIQKKLMKKNNILLMF